MQTIYANLVTLSMTPNEIVLDFAFHLPQPGMPAGVPVGVPPEARVVLNSSVLDNLLNSLEQAKKARDSMSAQQRAQMGFNQQ